MSLKEKLTDAIDSYQDFPEKGILFRDLLPVLQDIELFESLTKQMIKLNSVKDSEALIGIDARGFIFGTAISLLSKKPLVLARKPGKLPGNIISNSYKLEYGSNTLCLQKNAIQNFDKFCIVDDLLATGGTASSVEKMLLENNKKITGLAVVVELLFLKGREKLNCSVDSIVAY